MASAMAIPLLVAALVLCVAGVAKLRSPAAAAAAVGVPPLLVRTFAVGELALGLAVMLAGGPLLSGLLAGLYAGFALLVLRLARAGGACGCFGAAENPASPVQSALSAALSAACAAAAIGSADRLGWILGRPPGAVFVLGLGTAGAVYGIVLAYSELPQLWRSWEPA